MNMLFHGLDNPDIQRHNSLALNMLEGPRSYSVILANPPFAALTGDETSVLDLSAKIGTRRTELLFVLSCLRLLKPGGRAAIIVPAGVLFDSSQAYKNVRRILVEEHKLDTVVKLPDGTFKPSAAVSAAILFFTKTNNGGTSQVWFHEHTADVWRSDDWWCQLPIGNQTGPAPKSLLTEANRTEGRPPDGSAPWEHRNSTGANSECTAQGVWVSKADIAAHDYDLSPDRYLLVDNSQRSPRVEYWRLGDFAQILGGYVGSAEILSSEHSGATLEQRVLHPSSLKSPLPKIEELPIRTNRREPKYRLRQGDIVGRDLANNRCWTVLPESYEGVQAGRGIIVIRLIREVAPAEYIAAYLSSPQAERIFPLYAVIPRIRRPALEHIMIPACDGDFDTIRTALSSLDQAAYELDQTKRTLRESRINIFEPATSTERRMRLQEARDAGILITQALRRKNED